MSREAYDGWHRFAYAHNADVAAMCEAVGLALGQLADRDLAALPPLLRRTAEKAAEVKRQRSSRRKS